MFFHEKITPLQTKTVFNINFSILITFLISSIFTACKDYSKDPDEGLEMDGVEKAMRQEFLMTRDPALNRIPNERLMGAGNLFANARTTQINNLNWQERGPNNIGGRTRAIMIDKRDPSGNTVFAASVSGGIFKTTNFSSSSANWTVVDDQMANLAVTVMIQDKTNFNVMYAGTGEGWFSIDAVKGAGIFKSIDGGVTWTQLASTVVGGAVFEFVQDLVIDNNGNLYASLSNSAFSTARGVRRSTDGGNTWTQVLGLPLPGFTTGRAADLEIASNGDMYATLGIFTRTMVFKSSFAANGASTGALGTWTEITPSHSEITSRAEIAVAPSNPQRVYLMMQDSVTNQVNTFYRSNDGGGTWTNFVAPSALNNGSNSQTWYNLISAVDSANADVVIVGGHELAKSTDGGANWTNISVSSPSSSSQYLHVDQHALVFFNSSTLLGGNDGGLYCSTNISSGTPSYVQKNNGFNVTQFYGCDYHPGDANYFLAGAQDNNTQKFTSPGINSTSAVVGGDGAIPHIRQTDGQLQIAAATANNYFRSQNGGNTWNSLSAVNNSRGRFINPTDFDDAQNILYAGDDTTHYYCITNLDGTPVGTPKRISQMLDRGVTAIKIDPFSANTIWVGASVVDETQSSLQPVVLKITNANTTADVALIHTISAGASAYISSLDVDPSNANNVLVTLSNYGIASVWQSMDGGSTWASLDQNGVNLPDMPVRWGMFAPQGAQLSGTTGGGIILGTELGVWTASIISGTSTQWIANNSGMANVRTDMIKYRAANTSLVAATHGRGIFTTTLTGVVTGVSNNVITKDFIKYISADANQLLIAKGGLNVLKMIVLIYDVTGKLVYRKEHPYQDIYIPMSAWSKGGYVINIQGNNKENFVQQFIKR